MQHSIHRLASRFQLLRRYQRVLLIVLIASLVCIGLGYLSLAHTSQVAAQSGDRLLTVYDRGQQTSVLTKKTTVGAALQEAGVHLNSSDHVEPDVSTQLVAKNYQINIYRARPVTVVDGNIRQRIMTSYQTSQQIVKSAHIQLYTEDQATIQRNSDVAADGAGLTVTIKRAIPFTFTLYGQTFTARTQAKTVGAMLKEKQVTLGKNDRVSLPLDTAMTSGLAIRVWREGKQTITQDEDVDFDTQQIQDADQPVGYKKVQTPGVKGKKSVTYDITIQDGKEVSRQEIASVVTQPPVTQVEIVGTKVSLATGSHSDWMAAAGISPSDYGYVEYIISHESGWNPNSRSGSGACGLVQAYPCSKLGSNWNDPVTALQWGNSYVNRYGGWAGAYAHWQANGNY